MIEKPEIETDTAEICSTHFGLDRFMDTKLEKLKPGGNTIPQPYDGNGIRWVNKKCIRLDFVFTIIWKSRNLTYYDESDCIEFEFYREEHIGNIPSTSSSPNYDANVESNKTPISSDETSCNAKV